jgi:oxygen-independent coproporphyrinogen III oxidase
VQSFDADIQAAIGRIQPVEMIETCVAALRARGVRSINFDLMYGLPMQTVEKLDATLDDVVRLRPDRIALFGYAHLPEVFARQRRIDAQTLPDAHARFDMATHGHDRLTAAGYHAIGFDHFALPHDKLAQAAKISGVRRNFQGFTDDGNGIVIGLGASAISIFADRIIQNEKNVGAYRQMCAIGDLPGRRGVVRDADAIGRGAIIEKILCDGTARFDHEVLSGPAWKQLRRFASKGLLEIDDGGIHVPEAGRPYSRHIAAVFDELSLR